MTTQAPLNCVLSSLLKRHDKFCCLCFSTHQEQLIGTEDELVDNHQCNLLVSKIVTTVLGDQLTEYVHTFKYLCMECMQQALNSYNFINNAKTNIDLLSTAVTCLYDSFENTEVINDSCKTLFVSLNTDEFTTQQYYDTKRPVHNLSAAYRRFHSMISTPSIRSSIEILPESLKESKRKTIGESAIPIRTSEMLLNKHDSTIRCKECLKCYQTKLALRNHYIRVHAPKSYPCTECPKKFGSPAYLEAHKTESHTSYICSKCGKMFNNKNTFKMHEMGHFLRLVCQDCGRMYKNKTTYKKHIEFNVCSQKTRASPADAKYTCDYCNKKYTQKVSLRVHIQYEHGNYKPHVCQYCKKKFYSQSKLNAHMVKHTKERKFVCEMCNGKFVTKESLLYHTRIHTGDKPYECPHCNARFLSASRRSEHVKRQHTNATLECDICSSKFSSQTYLHKHKKTHLKAENDQLNGKMASMEKVNEEDFKQLTHELKRIDNDNYGLLLGNW